MPLTIHHLRVSSSSRVVHLCEELSLQDYTLVLYDRDPATKLAPAQYKALHPASTSPVIQDSVPSPSSSRSAGAQQQQEEEDKVITLAESAACLEYIARLRCPGSNSSNSSNSSSSSSSNLSTAALFPPASAAHYPDFLFWYHWSIGTFQPTLGRALTLSLLPGSQAEGNFMAAVTRDRFRRGLEMLNGRLRQTQKWLAGEAFTAADVMLVFSLTGFRYFFPFSLADYPEIVSYLKRVGEREAYQRAMDKCEPGLDWRAALTAEGPVGGDLRL